MIERTIVLRDLEEERFLYGSLDRNLHLLRRLHGVEAVSRGGQLRLKGSEGAIDEASKTVEQVLELIREKQITDPGDVERFFRYRRHRSGDEDWRKLAAADGDSHHSGNSAVHGVPGSNMVPHGPTPFGAPDERRPVAARSKNQQVYLDAIAANTITLGIGPAGTGKSYLAVCSAVKLLRAAAYRKLVLCRPAVEAGENLGFLPGDLQQKINPYLRPLYDALNDQLPRGQLKRYIEEDIIEILPLAYMRGRTLDHAVIILDEAQNATVAQMKMFLTRLGERSKMIITGDVTQSDLPTTKISGLLHAEGILAGISGVSICHFERGDVVRHPVVQDILRAYSEDEAENGPPEAALDRDGPYRRGVDRQPRRDR